jgi:hypothetical protein
VILTFPNCLGLQEKIMMLWIRKEVEDKNIYLFIELSGTGI